MSISAFRRSFDRRLIAICFVAVFVLGCYTINAQASKIESDGFSPSPEKINKATVAMSLVDIHQHLMRLSSDWEQHHIGLNLDVVHSDINNIRQALILLDSRVRERKVKNDIDNARGRLENLDTLVGELEAATLKILEDIYDKKNLEKDLHESYRVTVRVKKARYDLFVSLIRLFKTTKDYGLI